MKKITKLHLFKSHIQRLKTHHSAIITERRTLIKKSQNLTRRRRIVWSLHRKSHKVAKHPSLKYMAQSPYLSQHHSLLKTSSFFRRIELESRCGLTRVSRRYPSFHMRSINRAAYWNSKILLCANQVVLRSERTQNRLRTIQCIHLKSRRYQSHTCPWSHQARIILSVRIPSLMKAQVSSQ